MTTQEIISALQTIDTTYQSMRAFFYQKIIQKTYTNNQLATYAIDYTLLLPSSKFITNLNSAQVNAQMQQYIDLCDALILAITTTVATQSNLFYERIQNVLNDSVSQMNGFSINLLNAKYITVFRYKIPYNMSLAEALFLNNISLDEYALQASLNYNVQDFNNLLQNTEISLSKSL